MAEPTNHVGQPTSSPGEDADLLAQAWKRYKKEKAERPPFRLEGSVVKKRCSLDFRRRVGTIGNKFGERKMMLAEHLKRAWEAPFYMGTREEAVRRLEMWTGVEQEFCHVVRTCAQSGRKVVNRHVSNFRIIAGFHRKQLRNTIKDWDILDAATK